LSLESPGAEPIALAIAPKFANHNLPSLTERFDYVTKFRPQPALATAY